MTGLCLERMFQLDVLQMLKRIHVLQSIRKSDSIVLNSAAIVAVAVLHYTNEKNRDRFIREAESLKN